MKKKENISKITPNDSDIDDDDDDAAETIDSQNSNSQTSSIFHKMKTLASSIDPKLISNIPLRNEIISLNNISNNTNMNSLLPFVGDLDFQRKIYEHKLFHDTQYEAKIKNIYEVDKEETQHFDVSPHQLFVKNFISYQTPYNSLLLYHGVGSGKTCAAIQVSEEVRHYYKQMNLDYQIIIIASPTIQDQFRKELFNEDKLVNQNGLWTLNGCVGNNLISEVNPSAIKNIQKEKMIYEIRKIVNKYYRFVGYIEFANFVKRKINKIEETKLSHEEKEILIRKKLNQLFQNRLIIIDEAQNIRITNENDNKQLSIQFNRLNNYVQNIKYLFLSATPMYNDYREIIYLLNIMNRNDKRATIKHSDVFTLNGEFKQDKDGNEIGKELFKRKALGYISFIRSENPYFFAYRIYPSDFSPTNSMIKTKKHPLYGLNQKNISSTISYLDIYINHLSLYQQYVYLLIYSKYKKFFQKSIKYNYILLQRLIEAVNIVYPVKSIYTKFKSLLKKNKILFPSLLHDSLAGINKKQQTKPPLKKQIKKKVQLDSSDDETSSEEEGTPDEEEGTSEEGTPDEEEGTSEEGTSDEEEGTSDEEEGTSDEEEKSIESYISNDEVIIDEEQDDTIKKFKITIDEDIKKLTGKTGLYNLMTYEENNKMKYNFDYKTKMWGKIFEKENIKYYSNKIKNILDKIENSSGIILIYSQYLDNGILPVAFALEELGFTRYGKRNELMKETEERRNKRTNMPSYCMITGDTSLSPDNMYELVGLNRDDNVNGEKIKVVLISQAGAEGLHFENIRQIHILEPWFNMSRIEQIIGRGVRYKSHTRLELKNRNIEIYMHVCECNEKNLYLEDKKEVDMETVDYYIYKKAEIKAIKIGKISRVLKELSADCLLHRSQQIFSEENMKTKIKIVTSSGNEIDYSLGDKKRTSACDYMDNCIYTCQSSLSDETTSKYDMFTKDMILSNEESIKNDIIRLFSLKYIYSEQEIILALQKKKVYLTNIYIKNALDAILNDEFIVLYDKYDRPGRMKKILSYYYFVPIELTNDLASVYELTKPIPLKHKGLLFESHMRKKKKDELKKENQNENNFIDFIKEIYRRIVLLEKKVTKNKDKQYIDKLIDLKKIMYQLYSNDKNIINYNDIDKYGIYHYLDLASISDHLQVLNWLKTSSSSRDTTSSETTSSETTSSETTSSDTTSSERTSSSVNDIKGDSIKDIKDEMDIDYSVLMIILSEYYEKNIYRVKGDKYYLLYDMNLNDNVLISDNEVVNNALALNIIRQKIIEENFKNNNEVIGLFSGIASNKNKERIVFKILNQKPEFSKKSKKGLVNKGFSCDDSQNQTLMNAVSSYITMSRLKQLYSKTNGKIICIIIEVMFRFWTDKTDKKWILTPSESAYYFLK